MKNNENFTGVWTALITPFNKDFSVDFIALEKLLLRQISSNITGIILLGSTAEGSVLSKKEGQQIVEFALKHNAGKKKIMVNCGSNNTKETVQRSQLFASMGVDSLLIVCPYYNLPSQEGMVEHFRAVSRAADIPLVIYNVPTRTCSEISIDSIKTLLEEKNIIGIKEASNDISRIADIKLLNSDFVVLSGNDMTFMASLANGSDGIISVGANLFPDLFIDLFNSWEKSQLSKFNILAKDIFLLAKMLAVGTNPITIKYIMSALNLCNDYVKLPLVGLSNTKKNIIDRMIKKITIYPN